MKYFRSDAHYIFQIYLQGDLPFPSPKHMTPEAVAQAMRVLEIHDKLEHPDHIAATSEKPADRLGENEVEVLKEMCNVRSSYKLKVRFSMAFIFLL